MLKEKILANFQRIVEFTQKLSLCSQKYGFGIRKKTYSGSRGKKSPDPGSATLPTVNQS
jgi:hypothetical protein